MLRLSGRRLDLSAPFADAQLLDGSRLHVVIPSITRLHIAVNICKFVLGVAGLDERRRARDARRTWEVASSPSHRVSVAMGHPPLTVLSAVNLSGAQGVGAGLTLDGR